VIPQLKKTEGVYCRPLNGLKVVPIADVTEPDQNRAIKFMTQRERVRALYATLTKEFRQ
jgi:hypothetical protein